jgi:hypothetical protein
MPGRLQRARGMRAHHTPRAEDLEVDLVEDFLIQITGEINPLDTHVLKQIVLNELLFRVRQLLEGQTGTNPSILVELQSVKLKSGRCTTGSHVGSCPSWYR